LAFGPVCHWCEGIPTACAEVTNASTKPDQHYDSGTGPCGAGSFRFLPGRSLYGSAPSGSHGVSAEQLRDVDDAA